jgi:diguanylate cyclase (GGDEF)-like protein
MLDLDGFKQLNDARGHQEGDRYLAAVARAWKAELRRSDVIIRFGGDEFVVVMPSCSLERARLVADRLRALMPDGLTASAGVTEWESTQDVQALIACVDAALYSAKGAGRDRTVVLTE